ncbi:MAG: hypothetical protein COB02_05970 [Candidatus Cloacimonadota bacterium]|nr:MAG: hypothetical protein COB02_12120 [Candidatus Cloacimonadota bacterium]PCJ20145.1 MAG: hypothetical protein COB02_05970 [Candidatus Cloacimonadota bacterium]
MKFFKLYIFTFILFCTSSDVQEIRAFRSEHRELEIYGNKEIEFNEYRYKGDFNQFLQKNPQIITDSKFDQHTRINVRGKIGKGISINAVFDDSNDRDEDEKILMNIKGRDFELALGRISLDLKGTKYVLNNKKALGIYFSKTFRKLKSSYLISRSEGQEEREQFFGNGLQSEYILKKTPVVVGSEKVTIDGKLLVKGIDYEFDYEGGSLRFSQELLPIENTSNIIIEYESSRDGSSFKNRIFATRQEYRFNSKNRIGLSWAMEKDQIDDSLILSNFAKPHQLNIIETDLHLNLSSGLKIDMELAHSVDQQDIVSNTLPTISGNALDLNLSYKKNRNKFRYNKERIDPNFRSIGKKDFVNLGTDSDLVGDVDQDSIAYNYQSDKITFHETFQKSQTNLNDDSLKDTKRFQAIGGDFTAKVGNLLKFRGGYRNENSPIYRAGILNNYSTFRKKKLGVSLPFSQNIDVSLDNEIQTRATIGASENEVDTKEISFSSTNMKNFSWNYSFKDRKSEDKFKNFTNEKNKDHKVQLHYKNGRKFRTKVEWIQRDAENFLKNEANESHSSSININYKPNRKFQISSKLKQEEKRRIIKEITQIDLSNINQEITRDYITPTHPVKTITSSQQIRYKQNKNVFHRLSYRFRKEEEKVAQRVLTQNENYSYDLKWTLPKSYKLKYRFDQKDRYNRNSTIDKMTFRQNFEVTKSLRKRMTITANYRAQNEMDHVAKLLQEDDESGLRLEKIFSSKFRTNASILSTKRAGLDNKSEYRLGSGIVYTPGVNGLRIGVDLTKGKSKDHNTKDNSDLEQIKVNVHKNLFKDAYLEGQYKFEKEAPSSKGLGYSATLYKLKLSMDF